MKNKQKELKLRAWYDPKDYPQMRQMHYFDLFSFDSDDGSRWLNTTNDKGEETILYFWDLKDSKIMLSIGFTDKNNKEVYENDYISFYYDGGLPGETKYIVTCLVKWNKEDARFDLINIHKGVSKFGVSFIKTSWVVGNEFEGPKYK